jgi:hypothetical protein
MTEDLASLLQRLCVLEDPSTGRSPPQVPPSDGTINIQDMVLINKPQRHELDLLRHEWEKQRELTWHLLSKGRLKAAERNARATLAAQLSIDGVRSISTIGSINLLSYIHGSQTNASEVETYKWMHQCCTDIYGPQDPATLDSKRNLAWVYQAQNEEEKAHDLLAEILKDLITKPEESVPDIGKHFIDMSRATTDLAVLLCLQRKITECEELLGTLWSSVAFFTLKHKCSLRVASAMGRKLAGMGERDDAAFLLTAIVQSAVTDSGSTWGSYLNVSSHRILSGRGEVGEILRAYEKHVLPQLAKTMSIIREMMGFEAAKCEPVMSQTVVESSAEAGGPVLQRDLESFSNGEKLMKG